MNKNQQTIQPEDTQLKEDMKKLTIARLKAIPSDFQISVGGSSSLSRDEAIQSIISDSEIGEELVDIQMEFLRDMASGSLYDYE